MGTYKVGERGSLLLLDDDPLRLPARSWQIHRIRSGARTVLYALSDRGEEARGSRSGADSFRSRSASNAPTSLRCAILDERGRSAGEMDQLPPPPRHPRSARAASSSASFDFAAMSSPAAGVAAPDEDNDSDAQLARALAQLEAEHHHRNPPEPPPLPPPPIRTRRSSSSSSSPLLERKLQDLQDIEIAQLLDRVGHRLTDVRIAQAVDVRLAVEYPTTETFTDPTNGRVDYLGFLVAYTSCLVADLVPTSLLVEPTTTTNPDFSLTDLRDQLERFYVLCPPPVWQRLVLSHLASLWRWDDPTRTAACFGAYLLLWWYDLLFLAPCVALAALVIKASFFFPPSVEQLVRLAEDRNARSRDARVLGKQLSASSLFGYAGQGVKGIWSDLRARMRDVEREDEQEDVADDGEQERSRLATATSASPSAAASAKTPNSALGHLVASASVVSTSTAAPTSTPTFAPESKSGTDQQQEQQEQELRDPARRGPGGKEGDGDVSLYRLMRNLTATFGPNAILWLGELNDLGERIKKCGN